MKKIRLTEEKLLTLVTNLIIEENTFDGNAERNPYAKTIESEKNALENLLKLNGTLMTNIENGKDYLTYEILAIQNLIGKRFCLCQLIKDGEQYGAISIKPFKLFKIKNY